MRNDRDVNPKIFRLMWIVKLALRRPYTFVVTALLIFLLGAVSIR